MEGRHPPFHCLVRYPDSVCNVCDFRVRLGIKPKDSDAPPEVVLLEPKACLPLASDTALTLAPRRPED